MTQYIFEVNAVQRLGEQIGYGNLMSLASALWRRKLAKKYGEDFTKDAFLPVLNIDIKPEELEMYQKESNFYDALVVNALEV